MITVDKSPCVHQSGAAQMGGEGAAVFDKYQARSIKREISRVLWDVWDPIGLKDIGGPSDEYDSYVNGVYELLISGADDHSLARHLLQIVTETMELSGASIKAMNPTVAALRSITLPDRVEPNTP